jgi:hypothetical protein
MSKDFEDYLIEEYSNISQAHFKTIETITSFFRYYLIVMALPVTAIVLFFKEQEKINSLGLIKFVVLFSPWIFLVVSVVGFCVMLYIINLRLDAILYARNINGIRKYFFDLAGNIPPHDKLRLRVLPQSPHLPNYLEMSFFLPVVFVFAIIDTSYLFFGCYSFYIKTPYFQWYLISISLLYFMMHFQFYFGYAKHRETLYLKSHIIGIDIDGVLNLHRGHFCEILKANTKKVIDPDQIKDIPVKECTGLGVNDVEEKGVFNNPTYWSRMPAIEDAAKK